MPMNSKYAFAQKKKIGSGLKRISKEYLEMGIYIFVL